MSLLKIEIAEAIHSITEFHVSVEEKGCDLSFSVVYRSLFTAFMEKLPAKVPRQWGGYFRSDADHRDFTAIGTAAGQSSSIALHSLC